MKFPLSFKRESIVLSVILLVLILYFTLIIFSFKVDIFDLFQYILFPNKLLLIFVVMLFLIMFILVLYYIVQIISNKKHKKEGSKFRLRLTLFFLLVTSISLVPLIIISYNWISKSIDRWFDQDIENSLVDAIEVSKEFYQRLAEESTTELELLCEGCADDSIKNIPFTKIDEIYAINQEGNNVLDLLYGQGEIRSDIVEQDIENLMFENWRKVGIGNNEYLLIPFSSDKSKNLLLVRVLPQPILNYTNVISEGLQKYRNIKLARDPLKLFFLLLYITIIMPFVLLSFYLGLIISRDVTNPIRELVIATQKVAGDELEYRVETEAKDEWKQLINSFNKMTEDLRINKELLKHSERTAAWQDIAQKIAHEIKNPLTPIKLSAERILKVYKVDKGHRDIISKGLKTILTEVDNITDMVNEFSRFSRFPSSKLERHDIIPVLEEMYNFLRGTYKNIKFSFSHREKSAYLLVDKYQLRRAFLNVIYNSINAVQEGGKIDIHCYVSTGKKDRYTIAMTDNGMGIDDEIKDKIFDPYFSKDGEGSGLGLAIVEKIVLDNKGRIWFESKPGKTTFFMEFLRA